MAWHVATPDPWQALSPEERKTRGEISSDQCIIDDEHFFVRGLIEIPVVDGDEVFSWGVWVSLSRSNFERSSMLWQSPERVNEEPYFGWLCNELPGYESTLYLKTHVHSREVGMRPLIELEHTDHPLALEQRNGITMDRVREIAGMLHHRLAQKK